MSDKNTTVVTSSSGANWLIALGLFIIIAGGAYVIWNGGLPNDSKDVEVKIELPKIN